MDDQTHGIIPPMVTPFREDGAIDEAALRDDARYLVETAGPHSRAVCGSTVEGHTLSTEDPWLITAAVEEETTVDALLDSSFALGAVGSIAAILTTALTLSVELWNAVHVGDHANSRELHEKLLPIWNAIFRRQPAGQHSLLHGTTGPDWRSSSSTDAANVRRAEGPIREALVASVLL